MQNEVVADMYVSVSQQIVHVVLKTYEYNRERSVRFHPGSSTDIETTAFLEHRDQYGAQGRRFVFLRRWDLFRTKWSGREWVLAEQGARCMYNRTRR